jgi:hypothetical protein
MVGRARCPSLWRRRLLAAGRYVHAPRKASTLSAGRVQDLPHTRFDTGPFATDCPPELVGTSLDPLTVDEPVPIAAIKAAMAERKAISRKSLPLRVVSFDA